ncbi:hypothetical protein JB92DRAFT_3139641, partial [Gautieria morchelliformis]
MLPPMTQRLHLRTFIVVVERRPCAQLCSCCSFSTTSCLCPRRSGCCVSHLALLALCREGMCLSHDARLRRKRCQCDTLCRHPPQSPIPARSTHARTVPFLCRLLLCPVPPLLYSQSQSELSTGPARRCPSP